MNLQIGPQPRPFIGDLERMQRRQLSQENLESLRQRTDDTFQQMNENLLAHQQLAQQRQVQQQQFALQQQQLAQQLESQRDRTALDRQRLSMDALDRQRLAAQGDRRLDLAETAESKRMGDQERMDVQWQMESIGQMENDVREMLRTARGMEFTPEGRRVFSKLAAEGRAIQEARGRLRPAQYEQMLGQFLRRFEEADLPGYQATPPTIQDIASRQMMPMGNGNVLMMNPRNGGWSLEMKREADFKELAEAEKIGHEMENMDDEARRQAILDALPSVEQMADQRYGIHNEKGLDNLNKAMAESEKRLQERWAAEHPDSIDSPVFSQEKIMEEVYRPLEVQRKIHLQAMGIDPGGEPSAGPQPQAATRPDAGAVVTPGEGWHMQAEGPPTGGPARRPGPGTPGPGEATANVPEMQPREDRIPGSREMFDASGNQTESFYNVWRDTAGHLYRNWGKLFERRSQPQQEGGVQPGAEDPPPMPTPEEEQETWFQERPGMETVRQMVDEQLRAPQAGKEANAINELEAALREHGTARTKGVHPARFLEPMAIRNMAESGEKDPVAAAAKSVAEALKEKGRHYSLLPPWQQEAIASEVGIYDLTKAEDKRKVEQLSPGDYYMDQGLRIHRVPVDKRTMTRKIFDFFTTPGDGTQGQTHPGSRHDTGRYIGMP